MYKTSARKRHHNDFDLYHDLEKIKSALANTAKDVKGKTSEFLFQSLENAKDKTTDLQNTVSDYIAEKPFRALGFAVFSGILIGIYLRRK